MCLLDFTLQVLPVETSTFKIDEASKTIHQSTISKENPISPPFSAAVAQY